MLHTSESSESFVSRGSEGLIVNIAQIELEEYFDSISENASFGDEELYNFELYLTALNINSWFELRGLTHRSHPYCMLQTPWPIGLKVGFRYSPFQVR